MKMQDWERLSALMIKKWPNTRWDESNVLAYYEHLGNHDTAAVHSAMELCVGEGREFFPPCSVIVAKINELSDAQEKVPLWDEVLRWFKAAGGCGDATRAERLLRANGMDLVWQFVLFFGYRQCGLSELDDPDNRVHEERRVKISWETFLRRERDEFAMERALGRGDIRRTSFLERYEKRREIEAADEGNSDGDPDDS